MFLQQRRQAERRRYLSAFRRAGAAFRMWWLALVGVLTRVVLPIRNSDAGRVRRSKNQQAYVGAGYRQFEMLEAKSLLSAVSSLNDFDGSADTAAENSSNGTPVGITASASDSDLGDTVSYSLTDSAGGRFQVNSSSGVVTVVSGLNAEASTSHSITVQASSSDGSTSLKAFTIAVTDVNEFSVSPVADADTVADTVVEGAASGSAVGVTAVASDADQSNNTVSYSLSDSAGGRFSIDTSTGVVTTASVLDAESSLSHTITVTASSSDGSTLSATFTIAVGDVNEFSIAGVSDSDSAADQVAEGASSGTVVGLAATASDADATAVVSYSLTDSAGGRFQINSSTGVVSVANSSLLDAENWSTHTVTVQATSTDGSTASQAFTITVTDVDDNDVSAISDADTAVESIAENAVSGTAVGITASAADADLTNNAVTYSLTGSAGGRFEIGSATGVVTVVSGLDMETAQSHVIQVRASSSDGSSSVANYTIAVTDFDEVDVTAPVDVDAAVNVVFENATSGAVVGITASASDADFTTNAVTYSLTNNAGGKFAINSVTGVVTVAGALNAENKTSHTITVQSLSADGSSAATTFTITVADVDESDITALTDSDATANAINEGSVSGTYTELRVSASDADVSDTVSYAFLDDAGGRFYLGTPDVNGRAKVFVNDGSLLNAEVATSHTVTVRASSTDGSTSVATFTISVTDVDESDVTTPVDTDTAGDTVAENATVGTPVGVTASATDADVTTNAVTYTLADNAGGLFAIGSSTGVVTVAGALDRELAGSHVIQVQASSADGSTAVASFTITVSDVDEADVTIPTDSDAAANSVAENSASGTLVGITVSASDADATNNTVTYSFAAGGNAGGRFAINASTGVVTVVSGLDAETATGHNITVVASSADGSSSSASFSITVTNVNEVAISPVVDNNAAPNSVAENATSGATVGLTALAVDADAGDTISYSLTGNAGGRFAIDATNGVVTVVSGLDAETATSHTITVRASSSDGSTSAATFTVTVTDFDEVDVSAISDTDTAADVVAENAVSGSLVGIDASAVDTDLTNSTVTYSLTNNAGGKFAINSSTGVVTLASSLNAESATSHVIEVQASSADGSTSLAQFTITVTDIDESDVSAISDVNTAGNVVAENSASGTLVQITASAVDADVSNNTVTYSLNNDAGGRFAIGSGSGVVTVVSGLNREAFASHVIEVKASSADGSSSVAQFTITVSDVDETDVTVPSDANTAGNTVAENSVSGTLVGVTVNASDADATNNTVSYSFAAAGSAGGRFAINSSSGVVSVADGTLLDREASASHVITVVASSADGSSQAASFTITVSDVDEFDVTVPSDANGAANVAPENLTVGALVGLTAAASDADATNNTVSYQLTDDAGGRFAINSTNGVVTVAGALDAETSLSHTVTVRASSADGSTNSATFTIVVQDVDEVNIGAVSDVNTAGNTVAENSASGTVVGITASASDDDISDTESYALTASAGGRFAINSSTGVVTVVSGLDAETAVSHTITVRASSTDGSTSTAVFTITVTNVDEFPVSAISDANSAADAVAENSASGALVGITASATDADAGTVVSYSLDDNAGGRFAISSATGAVSVVSGLNAENATSHVIVVKASSSDGSTNTASFTVTVTDVDEVDVSAISDTNSALDTVAENAASGTTVPITAFATDGDQSNNTVTYSLNDNAGGRFAIDGTTGVVTVVSGLDAETSLSHAITVQASSSDGSSSTATFTIAVSDVDEFDVGSIVDADPAAQTVAEDAASGTAVGITALASDPDVGASITYSLTDDAGGRFAINSATGVVTVVSGLDYETSTSHNITVKALSTDGSSNSASYLIAVTDVNDNAVSAVSDADSAGDVVAENAATGTAVGITASATDADSFNNTVTYSLNDDAGGRFAINSSTGVVTVASTTLDAETAATHTVTVQASSADGSTSVATFTITVSDVDDNDVSAISDTDTAGQTVAENAASGTAVGITASATDADITNNTVSYSLNNDAGGRFAINSSGVVTVVSGLDAESASSHVIQVRASSSDGSSSIADFTITVTDVDDNDVTAVSDTNGTANSVAENSASGTAVQITAFASDADITNNTVSYSLTDNAGGRFTINSSSGVVTVVSGLDAETATGHSIVVQALSSDGSSSTTVFSITVTDVNEFGISPVVDSNSAVNQVAENSASGTLVGVVANAVDADATDTVSYSLTGNAGGRFAIHPATGVVTVVSGLNAETATSHTITVQALSTDGTSSVSNFTIAVLNVNEFAVSSIVDSDPATQVVGENATLGAPVGYTAAANDSDLGDTVSYSLTDNAGGRFAIDSTSGVVTVAGSLDAETATSHTVTVRASSSDGSSSVATFTVTVTDFDEFDVTVPVDTNGTANSVAETAASGTAVQITASAVDGDVTNNTVSYSLSDSAGGRFAINSSGVVTVVSGLDAETAISHTITVLAVSADGSSSSANFTIAVTDVNEFGVTPVTDANTAGNVVAENAASGSVVGITAQATDADQSAVVSYSLTDNAGGLFAINSGNGQVTLAGSLNAEAATSHTITVLASSTDGSTASATFTVTVTDVDEFDVTTPVDVNSAGDSVAEDATVGTLVGITASSSDGDISNNAVSYSLSDNAGGRFAIDSSSGVVTVAGGLDREAAGSHTITVVASSSDGSTQSATFTVTVTDVDEHDVTVPVDSNTAVDTVAENSASGTTVGVTASAADADATNNTVSYSLSGNAGGRFAINASTGVVTVADGTLLDYETSASHVITVLAQSSDGSTASQSFTIAVTNVNEYAVSSIVDTDANMDVAVEGLPYSPAFITASASDNDLGDTVTYSLSDDAGGRFTINSATGVVTGTAVLLDAETALSHNITVRASSSDGSTSTATFTITVFDLDEFNVGAVTDANSAANTVAENAASGALVGLTASAVDLDATNNTVTYALSNTAGGRFAIDSATGVVTVADGTLLDAESSQSHTITVVATGTNFATSTASFTIAVADVDEFNVSGVSDADTAVDQVAENSSVGTVVGVTATATDADVNASITYSLSDNAGGRFGINSATGVVTVSGPLDYETSTSHTITVLATSGSSTSSATFTITVSDVADTGVGPVSDSNSAVNTVAENSTASTLVGITALAVDPDMGDTVSYSLTDNAGGRFAIDSVTGVVSVVAGLDYETNTSHSITVRASSSDGSTSSATFSIAVTDVDEIAPSVASVRIGSSTWSGVFTAEADAADGDLVEDLGYKIFDNETLPWTNLDTIVMQFSEDVTVTSGSLNLTGITVPNYITGPGSFGILSFNYNPVTLTATWVLNGKFALPPMTADRVTIGLSGVTDGSANPLSALAVDQFNVNPGDINQNGQVNFSDLSTIYPAKIGTNIGGAGYSIYGDVTGNGQINFSDLSAFYPGRIGQTLPVAPPSFTGSGVLSYSWPADGEGEGEGSGSGSASGSSAASNSSTAPASDSGAAVTGDGNAAGGASETVAAVAETPAVTEAVSSTPAVTSSGAAEETFTGYAVVDQDADGGESLLDDAAVATTAETAADADDDADAADAEAKADADDDQAETTASLADVAAVDRKDESDSLDSVFADGDLLGELLI